jgi:hypothetical protein
MSSLCLNIFFTYLPGSGKRQDWAYLSSEQGVFDELGFKIVIMPSFEPNLNFIYCSFEKSGIFDLKAMGYLQKQCKEQKSC